MKKLLLSLSLLAASVTAASAADLAAPPPPVPGPAPFAPLDFGRTPPVVVQFGPTSPYSTINCANFTKLPDGAWKALSPQPFGLGFVQGIIPPVLPIKSGGFIYNNIDLYSQLEAQCAAGVLVRARY